MSGELQNLDQLEAAMEAAGLDPAPNSGLLERTRRHLYRYAELETSLLGEVRFPVPRHLLTGGEEGGSWETVADLERERLRINRHENADLMETLDRDGLKVYRPYFPEGFSWSGIFLFDRDVGPCLITDSGLSVEDANGVFAQLFGHYLLDHDPYTISAVSRVPGGPHTPSRAEQFAGSFLVGEKDLDSYLAALKWTPGEAISRNMLIQLASFFETSPRIIGYRLVGLERVRTQQLPGDWNRDAGPRGPEVRGLSSGRFLRLALEAHAREMLDGSTLAEYLEIEPTEALELAGRFRLQEGAEDGNGVDKDS